MALCFWLLWGDFGYNLDETGVSRTMLLLLEHFNSSDVLTGLLYATVPQVIGIVAVPVVMRISDRHRGRWGRRIPFLLAQAPLATAALLLLAFSPWFGGWVHHRLPFWKPSPSDTVVLAIACGWATYRFCGLISRALFFGLINDVVPKELMGRFFGAFRIVGLAAAAVFNYWVLGRAERHYSAVLAVLAVLYGVSFAAMGLNVKEGEYPPPPAAIREAVSLAGLLRRAWSAVLAYFRECVSDPLYRWCFVMFAFLYVASLPGELFMIYYAQSLHISMATLGKLGVLQVLFTMAQSYPAGAIADRIHPLRMTLITLAICAAAGAAGFAFVHGLRSFAIVFVGFGTLSGLNGTVSAAVPSMLFPKERFGTLYSAMWAGASAVIVIGGPCIGWAFDRLRHDYRYIFLFEGAFFALAFLGGLMVYRRFRACGGPRHYQAPA